MQVASIKHYINNIYLLDQEYFCLLKNQFTFNCAISVYSLFLSNKINKTSEKHQNVFETLCKS